MIAIFSIVDLLCCVNLVSFSTLQRKSRVIRACGLIVLVLDHLPPEVRDQKEKLETYESLSKSRDHGLPVGHVYLGCTSSVG